MLRILSIVLCCGLTGCGAQFTSQRTVNQQLETSPLNAIDVSTFNGELEIQGHSSPMVELEITYVGYGSSQEEADARCAAMDTDISANDGTITLVAKKPMSTMYGRASFKLMVPSSCDLQLKTSNGTVAVKQVAGEMKIDTSNGKILLSQVVGDVVAHTSNGAINVEDGFGTIDLKTSNGRVEVGGTFEGTENRIRTSNGRVTVMLPSDVATEIEATTSNGKLKCDLPVQNTIAKEKRSLHILTGLDGQETTAKLVISTSNGSITIGEHGVDASPSLPPAAPTAPDEPEMNIGEQITL